MCEPQGCGGKKRGIYAPVVKRRLKRKAKQERREM